MDAPPGVYFECVRSLKRMRESVARFEKSPYTWQRSAPGGPALSTTRSTHFRITVSMSDGSLSERERLVYSAKLAEQAERYDGAFGVPLLFDGDFPMRASF